MNKPDCINIRQAAMALADGEPAVLSAEQVRAHVAECEDCRREVESLRALTCVLDAQSRRAHRADLWPGIESRITPRQGSATARRALMLVLLVVMLLCIRGIVLASTPPMEWVVRLGALLLVSGWFFVIRDNPFSIQTHFSQTNGTKL